ncbi:SRPBCC family protein [Rhodococcus triatomae]|uniref:Polyketide cyclase / dehydrase and lipid transport n=1 Tax=Rhodococcus triatomae TaxID=300028 RepID=A0A1G8ANB7_9NOCA|nr:SRPBCC family protein [Rhodococcus triatomae]QNG17733.1 SRPBCC family protein [Rhodococcus triatomae]QNG22600.1 SRPBCC family protein [Rhodococcus triatomae]SDH21770.1 Polyketide cyclase / dehydrase and lipid transport [Rhodococcus triatomae]
MAKLIAKADVPLPPGETWDKASDLENFGTWFLVHEGWRSELPTQLAKGTELSSVVTVKGLRNRVKWTIKEYDAPRRLVLKGDGKGGVKLGLVIDVSEKGDGSEVAFTVELGGAPLFGPIGKGVAKALEGDIDKSLEKFVELYG